MTRHPAAAIDDRFEERGRIVAILHAKADRLWSEGKLSTARELRELATRIAKGDL